ncbi:MAG TPA: glycosyltransferase [Thermoanaerobaculia bacterium]|nr:glycosyltransferase [Thermoanaerobaculia bacterium]
MTAAELDSVPPPAAAPRRQRAVAVLMSRFPSVTETFILREMIEMERQAQPVRLVPMLKESPPVIHDAAKPWTDRALYTPFVNGPIVRANVRAFLRSPLKYVSLLARLIAGTLTSPTVLLRTLAVFPKSVLIAEELEREGVRHIHAHYATHPSTMALIIASFSSVTFSFTVHAHDIQVNRALLRWKLRETKFVRSISDYNKRFLEKLYPKEATGKIVVIHVGIETEQYAAAPPRWNRKLLCVAAHRPYKGLPYLIEACALLRDEGLRVECDLVGHGPMHDELAEFIRRRGVEDIVRLAGPKPQEEVTRMMSEAALFVLPSIVAADGQMEGIPVALMEAMASGRAVVSTAISGIPELVENGVSGVLVPPEDARALANAIRELLEDHDRARSMGERGREKVRAEFTLSTCVRELNEKLEAFA